MIRLLILFLLFTIPAQAADSYYPRSRWMPNPASDIAPGDITAPPAPSSLIVTPVGRGLTLTIIGAAEPSDFAYYEVHKGLSAGVMSFFSRGRTTQVNDAAVNYGTTYFYKVMAVDTTGNASAFTTAVSGTPAFVQTGDINPNATSAFAFHAAGSVNATSSAIPANIPGETVTLSIFSALSPILVNWTATIAFSNPTGATLFQQVILHLKRNGTIIQTGTLQIHVGAGSSYSFPIHLGQLDLGAVGSTTYDVEWAYTAGAGGSVIASQANFKVLELRR